jgi:hypothetical protein
MHYKTFLDEAQEDATVIGFLSLPGRLCLIKG